MPDNLTGLAVKSLATENVRVRLVDTGGTNEAGISAAGRISVDGSGVTQPVSGTVAVSSITTSVTPGTAAANLGKAVDSVAGASDTGVAVLAVRDDALGALTPADGDYTFLRVNDQGALHVVSTGGATGTEYTEGGTDATITGVAIMWEDTADTLRAVSAASPLPTVQIGATPAGTNNIGDVDVLTVPAPLSTTGNGTAATALRVSLASDSTGVVTLTGSLPAGTNNIGDVDVLSLPALPAGTNNIGDVDVITMPNVTLAAGTNTNEVVGDVAHDAVAAGNPLLMGAFASAAAPTGVSADADAVRLWALRNGALATQITAAGALIGGDATNGLDVDVTRVTGTVTTDTELTAPAALADATANPTITNIASHLMGFNGTTWDRVRTANTGRLQVDVVTGGGSNASILVDNAAFTDGTSSVTATGYIFDEAAGTALTENDVAAARIDSKRSQVVVFEDATTRGQRAAISAAGALASNLAQVLGSTHSATNPVFTRLTDGTAVYANTGQTAATAAFGRITDATNTAAVIATINALKTDLSSVAGAVPSATNPVPVRLTDGAAFYASAGGAPSSPQVSTVTSASLGAGASVDLDHTLITNGTTGHLAGVDVASAVPLKIEIKTVNAAGTPTTRVVLFSEPHTAVMWRAPYKTYITQAGAAANARFRVTVTNKDNNTASDVYSTATWDQV